MHYLGWALIALVGYSIFTPLASLAMDNAPSSVVAMVANGILLVSAVGLTVYENESVTTYFGGRTALYMVGAGVFLAVGILAYYRALAAGPVSIVTPVYGMFLVGSTALSVLFLDDSLTLQKGAGIALAVVAVYLTATG
ncbi:EamA family transporter [Halococcus qingdaonensis]|uniref:EamA family transporter n=1 Tax=Halococcus qingdaonensis TaxID=224402 RepID=UPI002116D0A6|nr:EamA family transporter [Halococcus qingdaonensis]